MLTPEQHIKAFSCEFDFDSPEAIDFDLLVERLRDLKQGSDTTFAAGISISDIHRQAPRRDSRILL